MQTEFEFTLPTGYIDDQGQIHYQGVMRRSRAMDEILPMQDVRVQANPAYATVIILARVIVRLGTITEVTPLVIENMFASDLSHLQTLYHQINSPEQIKSLDLPESVTHSGEEEASETLEKELAPV
ncbi:MAG: hypothetical protein AAGD25_11085 [Cyanobacteria bacterium P01_F01_bin.150]